MGTVEPVELGLSGAARVWVGGDGPPMLLLHGAWSGAVVHWSPVWAALADHHRVIAPDLPGLGDSRSSGLRSADAYVHWCRDVLDDLDIERVWLVGNSFGAGIAARLASHHPDRCLGLVLVDGLPLPALPRAVLPVLRSWPARTAITAFFRRDAYSQSTPARAFFDPAKMPAEIAEMCAGAHPERLRTVAEVVLAGDAPAPVDPTLRTLVIWGAADRMAGSSVTAAERFVQSLPDARLRIVDGAGHLPQIEQPQAFVEALTGFTTG